MAICFAPVTSSGGSRLKPRELWSAKKNSIVGTPILAVQRQSKLVGTSHRLSVSAEHRDGGSGGIGDFIAGFLCGSAVCGRADIFSPEIRRALLNEDEYGFRRAKRPIYYDGGLEETGETLNAKISQINSAIDNASTHLRDGNGLPRAPRETDPKGEATV